MKRGRKEVRLLAAGVRERPSPYPERVHDKDRSLGWKWKGRARGTRTGCAHEVALGHRSAARGGSRCRRC